MGIPYFLFWATVIIILLRSGFQAFDKTLFSNSASPLVLSVFKHFLAISICRSSTNAFDLGPQLDISFYGIVIYTLLYSRNGSLFEFSYFSIFNSNNFINFFVLSQTDLINTRTQVLDEAILGLLVHLTVGSSVVLVGDKRNVLLLPAAVLCTGLVIISVLYVFLFYSEKNVGKLVKFSIGIIGTIIFQSFFPFTSLDEMVPFLFFASAWLTNLVLLRASDEFGFFNFLIGSLIVGVTEIRFGLEVISWLAYGSSLLLFGLRLHLKFRWFKTEYYPWCPKY